MDEVTMSKLINELYSRFSAKQVNMKKSLSEIVAAQLKSGGFETDKAILIGLPVQFIDHTETVEYSVNYKPVDDASNIFTSLTGFYLGIGGQ